MSETCYQCGKFLPSSFVVTMGKPTENGWHYRNINAAAFARSEPIMKAVCDKCDPLPFVVTDAPAKRGEGE